MLSYQIHTCPVVERGRGVVVVHMHGYVRDLPELASRAFHRVPSQPHVRVGGRVKHRVGKLRARVTLGLHLEMAAHALELPAVQQGVGVRED